MNEDDPIPLHADTRFWLRSQAPQGYDYKRHEDWVRLKFQPVEDHKTWQKRLYKACEALASS